jgi:putative pyruvate formate lyase activating enzyme
LRCQFCQQAGLLYPVKCGSVPLSQVHWGECALRGARTISFAGGNPDESLPGVLSFLARAPESLQLPVVWNSNAYSTPETVALLEGVVDIYLPDFKFGCEDCANSLAGAPDYPELAAQSIVAYQAQGVPVIVRILVLPGHVDCCHTPALKVLSVLANPLLTISIRGQYRPLGGLLNDAGAMSGRASAEEVLHVVQHARGLDLNMTEDLAGAEM